MGFASDRGIVAEADVLGRVLHDHHPVGQYGMGAERFRAGRLRDGEAGPGLQPLPVPVNQSDGRDRAPADEPCEAGDIVEAFLGTGIKHVIAARASPRADSAGGRGAYTVYEMVSAAWGSGEADGEAASNIALNSSAARLIWPKTH